MVSESAPRENPHSAQDKLKRWLSSINPFPTAKITGEDGQERSTPGVIIDVAIDDTDATKACLATPEGIFIVVRQGTDISLIAGKPQEITVEDYLSLEKIAKRSVSDAQRQLSYK